MKAILKTQIARIVGPGAAWLTLATACPDPAAALRYYCSNHPGACSALPATDAGAVDAGGDAGGGDAGPPGCPGPGSFCGGRFWNEDPKSLYPCADAGSPPGSGQACQFGCLELSGADRCRGAPICTSNGWYCGNDGVTDGDPSVLYTCPTAGQQATAEQSCAQGCVVDPAPTPDYCRGQPMCYGPMTGLYCGGDKVAGGDPNTLYSCPAAGQGPTSANQCLHGCKINTQGTNDQCNP